MVDRIDRIGRHPYRTGDSKKSLVGSPKDVWNTSPPSSAEYRYRGNLANLNKYKQSEAALKKMMAKQKKEFEAKILKLKKKMKAQKLALQQANQGGVQQQGSPQVNPQIDTDPQSNPNDDMETLDAMNARMEKYAEAMMDYEDKLDMFSMFTNQVSNAYNAKPAELAKGIPQLESALKVTQNGVDGLNEAASKVYKYLTDEDEILEFSRTHEAAKRVIDLEMKTLEKLIKTTKEDLKQKELEAEKEQQDMEQIKRTPQKFSEPDDGGFQAHEPEVVSTNAIADIMADQSKKNKSRIIKNKPSTKSDAELRTMIDKVRELNPQLDNKDLSDEEMLDLIKKENERQRREMAKVESISFSEFYELNEAGGGGPTFGNRGTIGRMVGQEIDNQANSHALLNRLAGRGMQKLARGADSRMKRGAKSKPTATVHGIPQGMDKSRFFAVDYAGYTAANAACGKSLTEYRGVVTEHGANNARKLGKTFVMVYQRDNVAAEGDIKPELAKFYIFKDDVQNMKLMEGTEWRTTNMGYIFTMSGVINFEQQDNANVDTEISQDENKNVRYFVGCDAKGMEFFADNFHMSFRQYLQNARTTTPIKQDELMSSTFSQATGANQPQQQQQQQQQRPVVHTRAIADGPTATAVTKALNKYIKTRQNDIVSRNPTTGSQKQGFEVKFNNGDFIKYYINPNHEFVVNMSDDIFNTNINKIDPTGARNYKKGTV